MIIDKIVIENFKNGKKGDFIGVYCEKCGMKMVIREGYSKFLGCTNFPKCNNTLSLSTICNPTPIHKTIIEDSFNEEIETFDDGFIIHFDKDDEIYNNFTIVI